MKCKVCILNDLNLPITLYSPHHYAGPIPPAPAPVIPMMAVFAMPAPASAIDFPTVMLHLPGNAIGKNKYAPTVLHKNLAIIQAQHDLGVLLPHIQVTVSPANTLTALHILFSSRKVMFAASTVKAGGQPIGIAGLINLPPAPMLICSEPMSFPVGEVPTRWLNTVEVKFTIVDFVLGVVAIALTMVVDFIFKAKAGDLVKPMLNQIAGKMLDAGDIWEFAAKQGVAIATGVATMVLTGEGTVQLTAGGPYANVGVSVGLDSAGTVSVGAAAQGPGVSAGATHAFGSQGGTTGTYGTNWGTGGSTTTSTNVPGGTSGTTSHNTWGGQTSSSATP